MPFSCPNIPIFQRVRENTDLHRLQKRRCSPPSAVVTRLIARRGRYSERPRLRTFCAANEGRSARQFFDWPVWLRLGDRCTTLGVVSISVSPLPGQGLQNQAPPKRSARQFFVWLFCRRGCLKMFSFNAPPVWGLTLATSEFVHEPRVDHGYLHCCDVYAE